MIAACLLGSGSGQALAKNDGNASRIEVNAHSYPWSPIGRLNAGGRGHCTGFMIGEQTLLTAAHCLYDNISGRWRGASELHFVAAYQREDYSLHSPVESYQVSKAFKPAQSVSAENAVADWAVVRLKKGIGRQTGWFGVRGLDEGLRSRIDQKKAILLQAGYQRQRAHVITATFGCTFVGNFSKNSGLVHDCPIAKGDSGSPLLVLDRGRISVIGIHVLQVRWDGRPVSGTLSLVAFHPEATGPATLEFSTALKAYWGPGQQPQENDKINRLPLKAIDALLYRSGFLSTDTAGTAKERAEAIKKFQLEQKLTRDGQASIQLLEQLLLSEEKVR